MSNSITLINPTLKVNNEPIAIVSNEVSIFQGRPKRISFTSTLGSRTKKNFREDATESSSTIEFTLAATGANIKKVEDWYNKRASNVVRLDAESDKGTISFVIQEANIEALPKWEIGNKGTASIKFEGDEVSPDY